MDSFNATLHKAALQRRKLVRDMVRQSGIRKVSLALGISTQRVHQIINGKANGRKR